MTVQEIIQSLPSPPDITPPKGGMQFKDAAPLIAGVVDNGVCPDDPRVLKRLNEATKQIMDYMIPVGGVAITLVDAVETILVLPPELENCIEAVPKESKTKVYGDSDTTQGWYEIVNNSTYLDPLQHHDMPLVDVGLWPAPWTGHEGELVRVYEFPGLEPSDAQVWITGKKRYIPLTSDDDYLIVQNIEALKLIILSIERNENNAPDEAVKYRQQAFEMLQAEVKNHILDPRNYMRRKAQYQEESVAFAPNTIGWMRANMALDVEEALKMGRQDLLWSINQIERRIMHHGIYKDMVITLQAQVVGGMVYFPLNVGAVLAADLSGKPIPVRSQFFQHQENGPGMFPANTMLIDQGDEYFPLSHTQRRKYKLIADCEEGQTISAVCLLRWLAKKPRDLMVIKNYEAIRLLLTAKTMEQKEQWKESTANQQQAFAILDDELQRYLAGIKHAIHVQTYGFGLGDVGGFWNQ